MMPNPIATPPPIGPFDPKFPKGPTFPFIVLDPHPELDRTSPADHWWMHAATVDGINNRIAQGYRLFRLKADPLQPGIFTALFVRNQGPFERSGAGWELDLSKDEVMSRVANPKIRIISICPVVSNNSVLYGIVYVSNSTASRRDYKVLLDSGNLDSVLKEAQLFGGRIVDMSAYRIILKLGTFQLPFPVTKYAAVITKNTDSDKRTQWVGRASLLALSELIAQKNLHEKQPVRLVALEPAGNETFDYVLETRPDGDANWQLDSMNVTQLDSPDDLIHATRRLGARPIDLRRNATTGLYSACLIDTWPLSVQGKSASSAYDALDQAVTGTLKTYGIAGAVLAVTNQGKLVYAKGFGTADFAAGRPTTPETVFRIASISKSVSALATLRLIQDGALLPKTGKAISLDTKVFGELFEASTGTDDQKKLNKITLRNLLEHRTGFNNDFSWVVNPNDVLNHPNPVVTEPGTDYQYKNGHYHLVGQIIALVSKMPYETYVRTKLLTPLAIKRMGMTGALPPAANLTETKYYDQMGPFNRTGNWGKPTERRSGADAGAWVMSPIERQAASVWAASPIDLLRLIASVDGSRPGVRVLDEAHFKLIADGASGKDSMSFYGLGFSVNRSVNGTFGLDHNGYLPGSTCAYLVRRADGLTYCWSINGDSVPRFETPDGKKTDDFIPLVPEQIDVIWAMNGAVSQALDKLPQSVPGQNQDLFPAYGL